MAVFEVISLGTAWTDRIVKVRECLAIPSVRYYVLVEQDSAGLTLLERRDDTWIATTLTKDDTLSLQNPGLQIPVSAFYENVDLGRDDTGAS